MYSEHTTDWPDVLMEDLPAIRRRSDMDNTAFRLDTYLERLHYSGLVQPTEDRLEALHRAQVYTIPFENFDILLGRGISLAPAERCELASS